MAKSCNTPTKGTENLSYDQILSLMEIYRNEWIYRDSDLTSTIWRYVLISLVITFLPNLITEFGVEQIPLVKALPPFVFSLLGCMSAGLGMYLSLACAKRVEYVDKAYWRIMGFLPHKYQLEWMGKREKFFGLRLNSPFCIGIFLIIILLAIGNFGILFVT